MSCNETVFIGIIYLWLDPRECCDTVVLRSNGSILNIHPAVVGLYIKNGTMHGKMKYFGGGGFMLCFQKSKKNSFLSKDF